MARVFHLSDLHFGTGELSFGEFLKGGLNKTLLGYANRKLNPNRAFSPQLRERVLSFLKANTWDLLIISGDFTHYSYPKEFETALKALEPLLQRGRVVMVPGNHDLYTKSKANLFQKYFHQYYPMPGPIPGVQEIILEGWRIYLLDQSLPRAPFSSKGRMLFDSQALLQYLGGIKEKKIFVGHYPAFLPFGVFEAKHHQIEQRKEFQNFLLEAKAEFYLHGHIHQSWNFQPLKNQDLTVLNAGGCCRYAKGEKAGFFQLILEEKAQVVRILV